MALLLAWWYAAIERVKLFVVPALVQAIVHWNEYRLEVLFDDTRVCTVQVYLAKQGLYVVEFSREQVRTCGARVPLLASAAGPVLMSMTGLLYAARHFPVQALL